MGRCWLTMFVVSSNLAFASIDDYIYSKSSSYSYSNYGTIGLIQMPSARLHEAGSLGFNWSHVDPYLRGSIVAYPFDWFEASYQYTDVNNALYSDIAAFSGDQSYKDKSFDAKLRIFREGEFMPAVAIGARDLAGTGVFSSEYLVASKKIGPVDLTLGLGWGTLSRDKLSNPLSRISDEFDIRTLDKDTRGGEFNVGYFFSGNTGVFGGAEILIPNMKGLRFKIEYDATDYDLEGFPDGSSSFNLAYEPVKRESSPINAGFVLPLSELFHLKLNYIKGNTLSFGFSIQGNLGKKQGFVKKFDKPPSVKNGSLVKRLNSEKDNNFIYKSMLKYLGDEDLYLQKATLSSETLDLAYTQAKHDSYIRSAGRVMHVLDEILPDEIKEISLSHINGGMGMHNMTFDRKSFSSNKQNNHFQLTAKSTELKGFQYDKEKQYAFSPKKIFPESHYKISPAVRSQIGGPDGFFFGDFRISANTETIFAEGLTFTTASSIGLYDNLDELSLNPDSILPHVRTDIVSYLKGARKFSINRAQLNSFSSPFSNVYTKISAGILEEMFGGIGGEILWRPFSKDYALGAELWRVKQRDYDMRVKFRDYQVTTGHINLYYREPKSSVVLAIKGGRFLAGDSGLNFDFSRIFRSGLRLGAFFSLTDISEAEFGEGSFDKGFYFHIPIHVFFTKHQRGLENFGLRPITRDGAAILNHGHHLWGVTEQAQYLTLTEDWDDIYE